MTLVPWVDAAFAPSQAQFEAAYQEGYRAFGFYLPGVSHTDPLNVWTPAQVDLGRSAGLRPVPIVVPTPDLAGDPAEMARTAYQIATTQFRLPTRTSILYTGNHLETTGEVTGPIWIPAPGTPPSAIGAGSAVQWGQGSIAGWSVDYNSAALSFPFDEGLVVDFEYDTTAGQAGVSWYRTFQATIAQLGASPDPSATPTADAAPVAIVNAGQPGAYWIACADGGVFSFGGATFYGSMGGKALAAPVVDMVATPDHKGYWLVAADGGIFSFGDAEFYGSMGGKALSAPVAGMTITPTGAGYALLGSDGGVFTFGDAVYSGRVNHG